MMAFVVVAALALAGAAASSGLSTGAAGAPASPVGPASGVSLPAGTSALVAASGRYSSGAEPEHGSGVYPKVTLQVKDAELRDVLHMLSRQCGVGIVAGEGIEGTVSADLVSVPLDKALDIILGAAGYSYYWEEGAVVVDSKRMAVRVLELDYVDGRKVAEAVGKFVSPGGMVKAFVEEPTQGMGGGFSDRLLVREREDKIDELVAMVKALDVRPRQVYIEAKIVETTLGKDEALGIKWNVSAELSGAVAPTTFPFPKEGAARTRFSPTPDPGSEKLYIKPPFPEGELFPYANPEDFRFGKLSAAEFSVLMQAISARRNTELISSPKITTLDNKPAEILVGKQVPVALYERQKETGIMEIIGYEQQKVGVNLWVTPHVSRDSTVLLEISPETSSIVEFIGQYNERPVTSTRVARTQVLVRSGETVVIGGLIREVSRRIETKVPVLGDIPLLGYLFRHRSVQKDKVDLLVFITPRIVSE